MDNVRVNSEKDTKIIRQVELIYERSLKQPGLFSQENRRLKVTFLWPFRTYRGFTRKLESYFFAWAFSGRTRVNGFNLKDSKNILSCGGGEALTQILQRIRCPIPENIQGWVGWVSEQPHLVEGDLAHVRGL